MTGEQCARIRQVCAQIKSDTAADVTRFEGAAFTPRNVSEWMGCLSASVSALAGMVDSLAASIQDGAS